jgi:hypothetical protein
VELRQGTIIRPKDDDLTNLHVDNLEALHRNMAQGKALFDTTEPPRTVQSRSARPFARRIEMCPKVPDHPPHRYLHPVFGTVYCNNLGVKRDLYA